MKAGDMVRFKQPWSDGEVRLAELYGIVLGWDEHGRAEIFWSDGDVDYYMEGDGFYEMLEVVNESR